METVAARIHGAIKEQIIEGRYPPGARITEQNVAAEFSTSRTPVREAMRQLVADGFVRFKPNAAPWCVSGPPRRCARSSSCAS